MLEKKHNEIVEFQKELDTQFLNIYEQRSRGLKNTESLVHGLVERIENFKVFLPLSSLRSIGVDNKYESLPLMAKWVIGYNQMLGDLYTIIDMKNVINHILSGKFPEQQNAIETDDYVLYLRDKSITDIALVSKALKMHGTVEFKEHVSASDNNVTNIIRNVDYNWDLFKEENMSKDEWNLLLAVKDFENNPLSLEEKEILIDEETTEENKYKKLFIALVDKVYLDELGRRPIFAISIPKLVKYLLKLKAY